MKVNSKEIERLLSATDENCISIIVPAHRFPEGKKVDKLLLDKAVHRVKELLRSLPEIADHLSEKLDSILEGINYAHTKDGLGIFISPGVSALIHFPFRVKEKVSIGKGFEKRELMYYLSLPEYYVLSVSHKQIRLFKGKGEDLREVENDEFPISYSESYEYNAPSIASSSSYSLKAVEKDKTVLKEIRYKTLGRSADRLLGKYLVYGSPLILSGVSKDVAEFRQLSKNRQSIIGSIAAAHPYNKKEVSQAAWNFMQEYTLTQNALLLDKLRELFGRGTAVYGFEKCAEAAIEGRGLILMVEKDLDNHTYSQAHHKGNSWHNPAATAQALQMSGDVDGIISEVVRRKGKAVFMENGMLEDFGGIAMILRYNNFYP